MQSLFRHPLACPLIAPPPPPAPVYIISALSLCFLRLYSQFEACHNNFVMLISGRVCLVNMIVVDGLRQRLIGRRRVSKGQLNRTIPHGSHKCKE